MHFTTHKIIQSIARAIGYDMEDKIFYCQICCTNKKKGYHNPQLWTPIQSEAIHYFLIYFPPSHFQFVPLVVCLNWLGGGMETTVSIFPNYKTLFPGRQPKCLFVRYIVELPHVIHMGRMLTAGRYNNSGHLMSHYPIR